MNDLQLAEFTAGQCELCSLHTNRLSPVFARGPETDIMICGMVPGPEENKAGIPFIGRAGQLLDKILDDVGLLDKVYITNTVKCALRPGIPLKQDWIDHCLPYLIIQINELRPKVIITLGADATNGLLGQPLDTKIGNMRGVPTHHLNTNVVPTYHPSYLLRGGGTRHKHYNRVIKDFEMAKYVWEDRSC